jgi:hypothetical protein
VISDRLADELERSASSSTHRRALPARTQPRVGDPDLNDPQVLLLELAHGMLVDTETYIDCPYRYWPVGQVSSRRSACATTPDAPNSVGSRGELVKCAGRRQRPGRT